MDEVAEQRLYVISRSGSGEAMYLVLEEDLTDFVSYKVKIEHWTQIKDLVDFGVAVVRNNVYIIGGYDSVNAKHTNKVHRYDVSELRWSECSPMHYGRSKFGVGVVDDCIYISGGERNGGKVTGSCEMYNMNTGVWMKAGMLISPRFNHSCTVDGNEVYCAGGFHGNQSNSNLWVYEEYKWSELDRDYPHKLPVPLDRFCAITVGGTFYFIGGVSCRVSTRTGKARLFTQSDMFSYTSSISIDQDITEASDMLSPWNYRLPSLHHARHSAGAVLIGKKIYVIGGSNLDTEQSVRMVECFDLKRRRWKEDFRFRKGDVSNVVCAILKVPNIPESERQLTYKLKWVMW
ncbi:kelch-like protein 31 [Patella vulgata]|uniref:kelch-like protein 31 n=1 Tax=Patella vulgata TaxID=6465 RepID=UPI0024A8C9A4|nr:kelch-like protein 31 [Patella vulgata]